MATQKIEVTCWCDKRENLEFHLEVENSNDNHEVLKECYLCIQKHHEEKSKMLKFTLERKRPIGEAIFQGSK